MKPHMVGRAAQDVMSLDHYTYIYHYTQRSLLKPHAERDRHLSILSLKLHCETYTPHTERDYLNWKVILTLFQKEMNIEGPSLPLA